MNDDIETWEHDDAEAERLTIHDEPLGGERTEPGEDDPTPRIVVAGVCRVPCHQCAVLSPIAAELWLRGHDAAIESQLGGGVHAVRINLADGAYALLNNECFSFYDDDEDTEGRGHTFFSVDDPPNPRQVAILFELGLVTR